MENPYIFLHSDCKTIFTNAVKFIASLSLQIFVCEISKSYKEFPLDTAGCFFRHVLFMRKQRHVLIENRDSFALKDAFI